MTVVRWDPIRDFLTIQNEVGRAFERTFTEAGAQTAWTPAIDVFEKGDKIIVKAELPEVESNDVDVTYEDDHLTISGERKFEEEVDEEQFYRLERRYGSFRRTIPLPHDIIKADEIEADFDRGVLRVVVPRAEETKQKQIKVDVKAIK